MSQFINTGTKRENSTLLIQNDLLDSSIQLNEEGGRRPNLMNILGAHDNMTITANAGFDTN